LAFAHIKSNIMTSSQSVFDVSSYYCMLRLLADKYQHLIT